MKIASKLLLPIIILFFSLTILIFFLNNFLSNHNIVTYVLYLANLLFLLLAIIVFLIQKKALANPNPNVFIRSVIGGTMIKMFTTVIAVLAYVVLVGNDYNKKSVFISLFIYLLYLGVEVFVISKINKKNG